MPRSKYESLLILKIFRVPHDLLTKTTSFTQFGRNPFRKIIIIGKFLLIAEIYYRIFVLHNKFILETYFLTIKRFQKAADKLGDLDTIY
jgi:hypothetical protein